MNLRSIGTRVLGTAIVLTSAASGSNAQGSAQSSSATHVAAEMTNGKLTPADSRPGDTVALKLKDDLKANGVVVLKKGTVITGIVRNVKRPDTSNTARGETKGQAQSMMEIEWFAPAAQGKAAQNVSIALQSVTQVNPVSSHGPSAAADDLDLSGGDAASAALARPVRTSAQAGFGILGGAAGAATENVGNVVGAAAAPNYADRASGQSNTALLSMPSVVAVDHQTSSAIESGLGSSASGQLFKVGHGQLVGAGGSPQSVDIFSHLCNDTVITSQSRNFEISSGAQMQLLVGVNRK